MSIKIIADGNNRQIIGDLGRLPDRLLSNLVLTFKKLCRDVAVDATLHHRFIARSGNLERGIQSSAMRDGSNVVGEVFVRDSIADYGKFVHDGHGSWRPDPFIDQAFSRNEAKVTATIEAEISREMGI